MSKLFEVQVDLDPFNMKVEVLKRRAPEQTDWALGEIASRVQSRAIRKAPRKTSTLARAIAAKRIRKAEAWEVVAKTRYARYVELYLGRGRRRPVRMGKTAFMEPAVRETEPEIERILEAAGSKIVKG
ncbi:HK97 gp10 family phage protein [Dehalococcoidia bacterium]|nr:HK97 gp10 family phage protein [Dehalococcoidia bacterium]